ncbi:MULTISPECIES: bifunctional glutamate N-acetyltransferase/amino-acid acetyltransferase ArgJ [Thermodesulfovibrio]|uniref:bifunctional glutamate N-acetyltransferase/amino-acid acetyltransferase ArgJ n=1 Tax=Thermodesulfovibrio TaxID=28261 RepID=UPI0026022825|nr:bifunctional glutamate N-acetyltransferase/amino-acid acetyltransferase ArgJ [Thermodesulfovibrio sp.]
MEFPSPKGFEYAVTEAGIKYHNRNDLALIFSKKPAQVAGVFTTNQIKAAPIKLCMKRIKSGVAQAVIINSGNANACTGKKGIEDAEEITKKVAEKLGINQSLVYPLSTGVIGNPMPMERIIPAVDKLIENIGKAEPIQIAQAMMTTDTFPKMFSKQIEAENGIITVLGICKGAGMIAPNMATMLCVILTDAKIDSEILKDTLKFAVSDSFNSITIDGDMSTNDTVLLLANGESETAKIDRKSKLFKVFREAIHETCLELSKMIVKDGEGATKFITINVKGAKTSSDARRIAKTVANSPLVKTAFYGGDPNWGRIIAAIGYSGASVKEDKIEIYMGGVCLFYRGLPTMKETEIEELLKEREIEVLINLNEGHGKARVFTTDLSEEYVRVNSAYRT